MNLVARWNLQHNVKEDKSYQWTDYTPEDSLDRYILAKVEIRNGLNDRLIMDANAYNGVIIQITEDIEKALEGIIKGFGK